MSKRALIVPLLALLFASLACNAPGANKGSATTEADSSNNAQATLTLYINPTLLTPAITNTTPEAADSPTEVAPSPTTALTPTGCGYWASFVDDVTIPDGTEIPAGETFTKTWKLQNSGCLAWANEISFVFLDGDQLGGPNSISNTPLISTNEEAEISVELTAPLTPGEYISYWGLVAPGSVSVGAPVYVQITVVGAAWQRFEGTWTNPESEGIATLALSATEGRIVITRTDHCDTGLCGRGSVETTFADAEDGTLVLTWTGAEEAGQAVYKQETQLLTLLGDGRLQVAGQVDYVSNSRQDTNYTLFFEKTR